MDELPIETKNTPIRRNNLILNLILVILCFFIIFYYLLSNPLNKKNVTIHIGPNESLSSVASELKDKNAIRQAFILKIFINIFSSDKRIPKGDYFFTKDLDVWNIAWNLARGDHNVSTIKVTFPEGSTNEQMSNILANLMPNFRRDLFLSSIKSKQGYLFPDTYLFFPLTTTDEMVDEVSLNFGKRIHQLNSEINSSGKSLSDIIIMASIIQKEAKGKVDAPTISGILWKRISINMPLQVDIDRETYSKVGLPSLPISNPGLVSIQASINPVSSPYLYYIHDKGGIVHYAITFAEHKKNIAIYLK